jgi:phosphotransferase system  glucose/maltose/N-acetylglucosamine-specific IIC component
MAFALMNVFFPFALWLGLYQGIDGARNLAVFIVWCVALPAALIAFSNDAVQLTRRLRRNPTLMWAGMVVGLVCWGMLVHRGYALTSAVWALWVGVRMLALKGALR